MPFNNPIVAGNTLVRPAIQSPDYVPGTSGWAIMRDGTVEFNDGNYRGAVMVRGTDGSYVKIDTDSGLDIAEISLQPVDIPGHNVEAARITAEIFDPVFPPDPDLSDPYLSIRSPRISGVGNSQARITMWGTKGGQAAAVRIFDADFGVRDGNIKVRNHFAYYGEDGTVSVTTGGAVTNWSRNVSFSQSFTSAPKVLPNIAYTSSAAIEWTIRCINITTTGFTMVGTGPSSTWTNGPVDWVALSNS